MPAVSAVRDPVDPSAGDRSFRAQAVTQPRLRVAVGISWVLWQLGETHAAVGGRHGADLPGHHDIYAQSPAIPWRRVHGADIGSAHGSLLLHQLRLMGEYLYGH